MSRLDPRDVVALVQARVKRVLDLAELAVPADKFERFRTMVLDEFGHKGCKAISARRERMARTGMEWAGTTLAGKAAPDEWLSQPRLVEIDLPDLLPVLDEELALIEAHFAELIAAMLEADLADTEPA